VRRLVSFDLSFTFTIDPLPIYIILAVCGLICAVFFVAFLCIGLNMKTPDAARQGNEVVTWTQLATQYKKRNMFMQYMLILATSAYLPIGS
jgi:uncharacterized membrane protein YjgN (DUF898 family)